MSAGDNLLAMPPPEAFRTMSREAEARLRLAIMAPDELRALVAEQATRLRQHEATDAELRRLVQQQQETIDRGRVEPERLGAELVAMRRANGDIPRTVGDLREWREARGLTQARAAELLHVGRATVERAEAEDHDSPLGPALRRAFQTDARGLASAEDDARAGARVALLGTPAQRATKPRAR
jgi:DNA-binding XRE family transcriptional regulator